MPQTYTVPSVMRGGSQTPIVLGPFAVPAGATEIVIQSSMPASQVTSTAPVYRVVLAVEQSVNGGTTDADFSAPTSLDWKSDPGNVGRYANPPGLVVGLRPGATHVRGLLTIPTALVIGATITLNP